MNDDRLHIIVGVPNLSNSQNQHVGVLLTSILENITIPVTAHILYCEIDDPLNLLYEDNITNYNNLQMKYDFLIEYNYFFISNGDTSLKRYFLQHPKANILSHAAALRCFAPEIFPNNDWVLYLDTDIIVNFDLAQFWLDRQKYESYALVGCIDESISQWPKQYHSLHLKNGLSYEKYFNSGFLLMNLKKIRDNYKLDDVAKYLMDNNVKYPFYDQDFLNHAFKNDVFYLPSSKYDNMIMRHPDSQYSESCIHFTIEKPWLSITHPSQGEYWYYLFRSPWGDTPEKIAACEMRLLKNSQYNFFGFNNRFGIITGLSFIIQHIRHWIRQRFVWW
jgi:lipopolysaccharide biosynthesis glycosyltransferase